MNRVKWFYFSSLLLLFPLKSFSVSNLLIIGSVRTQSGSEIRHLNAINAAYDAADDAADDATRQKLADYAVTILAQDSLPDYKVGDRNHNRATEKITPRGTIDFESFQFTQGVASLENILSKPDFQKANGTTIIIAGHGGRSETFKPEDSKLLYWNNVKDNISFSQLEPALRMIAKPEHPVRIVCLTCYGGGIHELSAKIDNVCSASTTTFHMVSKNDPPTYAPFLKGFLNDFKSPDSPRSFAKAAISGYREDKLNINLGQLSSDYYIDSILKRGVHNPNLENFQFEGKIERSPGLRDSDYYPTVDECSESDCD